MQLRSVCLSDSNPQIGKLQFIYNSDLVDVLQNCLVEVSTCCKFGFSQGEGGLLQDHSIGVGLKQYHQIYLALVDFR